MVNEGWWKQRIIKSCPNSQPKKFWSVYSRKVFSLETVLTRWSRWSEPQTRLSDVWVLNIYFIILKTESYRKNSDALTTHKVSFDFTHFWFETSMALWFGQLESSPFVMILKCVGDSLEDARHTIGLRWGHFRYLMHAPGPSSRVMQNIVKSCRRNLNFIIMAYETCTTSNRLGRH